MTNPNATDLTNVAGTYHLGNNKQQEILTYSILDVANKKYLYYTERIDVAKRLEEDWGYYDTYVPKSPDKKLVCTSSIKE